MHGIQEGPGPGEMAQPGNRGGRNDEKRPAREAGGVSMTHERPKEPNT
jgi:hypothetical protein